MITFRKCNKYWLQRRAGAYQQRKRNTLCKRKPNDFQYVVIVLFVMQHSMSLVLQIGNTRWQQYIKVRCICTSVGITYSTFTERWSVTYSMMWNQCPCKSGSWDVLSVEMIAKDVNWRLSLWNFKNLCTKASWDMMPWRLVEGYWRLEGLSIHLQGPNSRRRARNCFQYDVIFRDASMFINTTLMTSIMSRLCTSYKNSEYKNSVGD